MRSLGLLPVVALALSLPSTGCFYRFGDGRDDVDDAPPAPYSSGSTTTTIGQAESMSGSLGTTRDFSTTNVEMRLTQSSGMSGVRLDTLDAHGRWVMNSLTFSGANGVYNPMFSPGARLSFRGGSTVDGVRVSVLGCTGPSRNNFDWDHSTSTVDVTVTDGPSPDSVRVTYVASFSDGTGSHEVRGTFIRDPE